MITNKELVKERTFIYK